MIHVLLGTRAQVIKMAPVMHLLQQRGIPYNFIFMAQHRDTVYETLDEFGLKPPDHVLGDLKADIVSSTRMALWSLSVLASGIRQRSTLFQGDREGIVLLHGDAPPLFLGAIIARAQGLRVAAIESGLRSFNYLRPFPEELVRVATGKLGLIDYHFCQDQGAAENAARYKGQTFNTQGNTIRDAVRLAAERIEHSPTELLPVDPEDYAIVTLHRFETISSGTRLAEVVELVRRISRTIRVKFILHPPTRAALEKQGLRSRLEQTPGVELLPRLSFLRFQALIANAQFLVTDGGSNQEESFYMGLPCLLLRSETERGEGLGENVVVSAFQTSLIDDFVSNYTRYRTAPVTDAVSPSQLIVDTVAPLAGYDMPVSSAASSGTTRARVRETREVT